MDCFVHNAEASGEFGIVEIARTTFVLSPSHPSHPDSPIKIITNNDRETDERKIEREN